MMPVCVWSSHLVSCRPKAACGLQEREWQGKEPKAPCCRRFQLYLYPKDANTVKSGTLGRRAIAQVPAPLSALPSNTVLARAVNYFKKPASALDYCNVAEMGRHRCQIIKFLIIKKI